MTETTWKIIVRVFGDAKCPEKLLFTRRRLRTWSHSNTVPDAQETRFGFTHKLVTPTVVGVDLLKQQCDQYPWAPGTVLAMSRAA
jgi:hypothetical protein